MERTYQTIAQLLGLDYPSPHWHVSDQEAELGLYMINPTNDSGEPYYRYKGTVVECVGDTARILIKGFGHTPVIVTDQLPTALDLLGYSFDQVKVYPGQEGAVVRVFKHRGQVFFSTNKKFNGTTSRWSQSKSFYQLYQELGGPDFELLFDPLEENSRVCYHFMLVHPSLAVATKLSRGYLSLLSVEPMVEGADKGEVPFETSKGGSIPVDPMELGMAVYVPPRLIHSTDIESMLEDGFLALITPRGHFRVESHPYHHRVLIRGGDPNPYHRLWVLMDLCSTTKDHSHLRDAITGDYPYPVGMEPRELAGRALNDGLSGQDDFDDYLLGLRFMEEFFVRYPHLEQMGMRWPPTAQKIIKRLGGLPASEEAIRWAIDEQPGIELYALCRCLSEIDDAITNPKSA